MAYTCVVTGATGFVGTELCKQLLERGWNLVEADLLRAGSFHQACADCDFVFHVASPFFFGETDTQKDIVEPAVQGTRNVLLACAATKASLRRVVLTSSVAAVKGNVGAQPPLNGKLYTEEDWNDTSSVESGEGYWLSKTQAEKLAWSLAKEHKLDLVTILPNFVLGPALSAALPDSTSVGFLKGWLEGNASKGSITYAPDVRDVARAHILAATTPSAAGRYIVSEAASASPAFISATLRERFPQYDIPVGDEEPSETTIDNSKAARELGLQLTPLAVTLVDMAVTLIALGVATPKLR